MVICMNAFRFFPIHADYRHAVMQTCHADYQHPSNNNQQHLIDKDGAHAMVYY
jgi:hypothetical protein